MDFRILTLLTNSRIQTIHPLFSISCRIHPWDLQTAMMASLCTVTPARARACSPRVLSAISHDKTISHDTSLFFQLVLGCIETKVCIQIRILQHFFKFYKIVWLNFQNLPSFCKKKTIFPIKNFFYKY